MGKVEEQHLQQEQIGQSPSPPSSSAALCERIQPVFVKQFSFKCVLFLLLGLAVFLSAFFWILPRRPLVSVYDANESVKNSATIQAFFRLQKPARLVVPHVERLQYDMYGEIGFPNTEVAVLSVHQANKSDSTDVVFGILSNPMGASIDPVSLSVLRSSFVDLFLQQFNMTLTESIFGKSSFFEILMFPGGITVAPEPYSFWQSPQVLFNFTLNNSIRDVENNYSVLKRQLKYGLRLRTYENVYIQVTNKDGSTIKAPVTAQASVTSDMGNLMPERLKQLAQIITGSPPTTNLGLDNSVFGTVKEVILSSFLNHTLESTTPAASPAPSPANDGADSPEFSPLSSPAPSPNLQTCYNCRTGQEIPPSPCPSYVRIVPPPPFAEPPLSLPPAPAAGNPMGPEAKLPLAQAPSHDKSSYHEGGNNASPAYPPASALSSSCSCNRFWLLFPLIELAVFVMF